MVLDGDTRYVGVSNACTLHFALATRRDASPAVIRVWQDSTQEQNIERFYVVGSIVE
jgi:hypothetical protein